MKVEYSTLAEIAAGSAPIYRDVTSTYGYDAVGNLTLTRDALGNNTYSYYDALGRVVAVAAPARSSTVTGTSVTPLTIFRRNAHGNIVVRIDSANGAANGSVENKGVASGTGVGYVENVDSDHRTLTKYDLLGRAIQTTDAEDASSFVSYNERGQVAKTWQAVTAVMTRDDSESPTCPIRGRTKRGVPQLFGRYSHRAQDGTQRARSLPKAPRATPPVSMLAAFCRR